MSPVESPRLLPGRLRLGFQSLVEKRRDSKADQDCQQDAHRADDRPAPKNILVQLDTSTRLDLKYKSSQPVAATPPKQKKGARGRRTADSGRFCTRHSTIPASTASERERTACTNPGHTPTDKSAGPHQLHIPAANGKPVPFIRTAASRKGPPTRSSPAADAAGRNPISPHRKSRIGIRFGISRFAYPTQRRTGAAGRTECP